MPQTSPLLPFWVRRMFDGIEVSECQGADGRTCSTLSTPGPDSARWRLGVATLAGAACLDDDALRDGTRELYEQLCQVAAAGSWFPVRFWNFIPEINRPATGGLDRYMVFNAGRYEALVPRFTSLTALPTATGVGHDGDDLHVFCLATDRPGTPVENPRQRSAYRYSRRFGPRPPCFSRATTVRLENHPVLLIGGTAAIRGEETACPTCLEGQIDETFCNLEALVHQASDGRVTLAGSARDLRVFVRRPQDIARVEREIKARIPTLRHLETMSAAICRDELLVEIEGTASLSERAA